MTPPIPATPPQRPDRPVEGPWSPLLDRLPLGVLLSDGSGRWIEANDAASRILGLPRETLLGGNLHDPRPQMLSADGSILSAAGTPASRALATGAPVPATPLGWVQANGETLWLEVAAEPLAGGGVLVSFQDITETHVTNAILAARDRLVERAVDATLEDVLRATLDETERLTASRIGFYHFVDPDQDALTLQAWSTRTSREFCKAEGTGLHYPIAQAGVWVEAFHRRMPVIHNDYPSLPHRKGLPEGHAEVLRELVVPVLRGGRIVALLGVGNKPFDYGAGDVAIVQRLAELAWDLAERKRAEAALRASEAKYRHQFDSMRQGAFLQRADGTLLDVNPAALELFGLTREAFLGRTSLSPAWDVVHEDGSPWPGDQHPSMAALRTGKPVTGTVAGILNPATGARVWVEVNAMPEFRDREATPFQVLVTLHDLTDRRRSEDLLRVSEERFRILFERMAEGYSHCRMRYDGDQPVDWVYLSVNPAFEELTGLHHATGRWVSELIPGLRDSSPELFETYGRVARVGVPERFETFVPLLDSWYSVSVFSPGPEEFVTTFENITARKRDLAEILAVRELQRQVLDSLDAHVAVLDAEGRIIAVNEPWRRFAHENGIVETVGTVEQVNYLEAICRSAPQSDSSLDAICAGLREVLGGLRATFQTEYPCNSPGELRWFRMTVLPLRSGQGGAVVTHENITTEREALEALRQAHSRLTMAQRSAGAGMWDWEVQTGRITWSPELYALFGLDPGRGEASFAAWRTAIHPEDVLAAGARIEAALAARTPLDSEYRVVLPDGSLRWIQALGSTVYDPAGRPERMSGICLDVTERKRIEAALHDSEARWHTVVDQAGDGFEVIDQDGRFIEVNETTCQRSGYSREELLGMTLFELDPGLDPDFYRENFARMIGGPPQRFEREHRRKDGTYDPVEITTSVIRIDGAYHSLAQVRDIRERRRAEEALRRTQEQLTLFMRNSPVYAYIKEVGPTESRVLLASENFVDMVGIPGSQMAGKTMAELFPPEFAAQIAADDWAVVTSGEVLRKDEFLGGRTYTTIKFPLPAEGRRLLAGYTIDISERVRTERALQASEAHLKEAQRLARIGHWEQDHGSGQVLWSEELYRIHGLDPRKAPPDWAAFQERIHPEDRARVAGIFEGHLRSSSTTFTSDYRIVLPDGRIRHLRTHGQSERDADGRAVRTFGTDQDMTEQVEAQQALVQNETRFRTMFEESPVGMWEEDFSVVRASLDALRGQGVEDLRTYLTAHPEEVARLAGEVRILDINQASVASLKARDKDQVVRNLQAYFIPASLETFREEVLALDGGATRFRGEIPCANCLGKPVTFDLSLAVVPGSEQDLSRVLVSFTDITERKRLEENLRKSEEGLATAQRLSRIGSWEWDLVANKVDWSVEMFRLFGMDPAAYDRSPAAVLPKVHPEDRDAFVRNMETNLAGHESGPMEYRVVHPDGSVRWLHAQGVILRDAEGRLVKNLGTIQDITEHKQAEAEHRALEAQLQRTQKMESLGSLAGGVAHDMNNVLGAIMALASLHEQQAPPGTPLRHSMETINKACLRGRTLVQGLLGFARHGLAEVKVLDLNGLIREQADLLAHTTLQRVRLQLDLEADLRPVQGDPSALSHALMNLCVNAVDAMPEGGSLTLRTRNQEPALVELVVEDTGTGMAPEVLARAVDPFFTTKPQGKGTGLGLSIVYGVVKAHRGRMDIQSTPGEGTRILLSFPGSAPAPFEGCATGGSGATARSLRVLVVDDDELVQASMATLLAGLGHRQVTVASGEAALERLLDDPGFHAVILDVNMPGLGGHSTLPLLRARHPALPVLLATGRPSQAVLDLVEATPAVALLAKPFTLEELRAHLERLPGGDGPPEPSRPMGA